MPQPPKRSFPPLFPAELGPPISICLPVQLAASAPPDWTATGQKRVPDDIPKAATLDTHQAERARAHILVRLAEDPRPSYELLREELGFTHRQQVGHHVKRLVEEGLLATPPGQRFPTPTEVGRNCAAYLRAYAGGELVWRRVIRSEFGRYSRSVARLLMQAAEQLDHKYAIEREGATRKTADGGRELERKVTARDIVRALRTCTTTEGAARMVGLANGAFRDRVATLIRHARKGGAT